MALRDARFSPLPRRRFFPSLYLRSFPGDYERPTKATASPTKSSDDELRNVRRSGEEEGAEQSRPADGIEDT